jgi:1-acyl-sn-glycerol-3-phosphate acyltransferase
MIAAIPGRLLFRLRLENPERILDRPAVYCFNHLSWLDPMALIAAFPRHPQLFFYGPQQEDMHHGGRNRIMWWSAIAIPFTPNRDNLRATVRQAHAVFDSGGVLAISGEGAIHVHEGDLLPFKEGAAYIALRAGVPIVPVALTGSSWARFRGEIRIRIGDPIETAGQRPTRANVAWYTAKAWHSVKAMVAGDQEVSEPGPLGRWFTDLFNDWGPGGRDMAGLRRGPRPEEVPLAPAPEPNRRRVAAIR